MVRGDTIWFDRLNGEGHFHMALLTVFALIGLVLMLVLLLLEFLLLLVV